MIKIDDLKNVKGIGPKAIERVEEYLEELKGDEAYVSKYDSDTHISPGDLVQGDMLEVMNGIPDGSIDMILTDLPYGTTACSWDSVIDFDKMWKQYNRVIKPNGAIVLFGSEPFSSKLRNSNIDDYRYDWVWEKNVPVGFLNAKRQPLKDTENICVFYKALPKYNPQGVKEVNATVMNCDSKKNGWGVSTHNGGKLEADSYVQKFTGYPRQVLRFSRDIGLHPTQKPLKLLEYLIKTYTDENEVVLDSTMGSGSTGVASTNVGRQFIGIELDEDYFEIAKRRINEAKENVE